MINIKTILVTGTDTGVGKTVVTGCLARFILDSGYSVITQKWVETGSNGWLSRDIQEHLKIMGRAKKEIRGYLKQVSPYVFKKACSPHLAARLENKRIHPGRIIKSFKSLSKKFDFVVIEGAGGALVPFSAKSLLIDLAKGLDLPVLVVAQNKLGAINHTLLTIEALRMRKMKILGIIFNNLGKGDKQILRDNPRIIKALTDTKVLGVLNKASDKNKLYQNFIPIGKQILKNELLA